MTIEEALKALRKEFYPVGEERELQERFEELLDEIQSRADEIVVLARTLNLVHKLERALA